MQTATYTKLRNGSWGVKLTGVAGTIPSAVTVSKRDGTTKLERIAEVLWRGDGAMICTIAASQAPARSGYGGGGYRPVRGCSACKYAGTMCKQCRFDEYDN